MATEVAWIIALILVLTLAITSECKADADLPDVSGDCAPEVEGTRRAVVVHDGAAGVWFERNVTLCMVERLRLLPLFADRVRLLEQRLVLSDERHALMVRQVELANAAAEAAEGALHSAIDLQRQAESVARRERSLRWVWALVTVVITSGIFAMSVWGYSKVRVEP